MFVRNRFWRLGLLTMALVMLLPGAILSNQQDKTKKHKKTVPEGVPVLWQAPTDITKRDLYWGPGGEALKPDLSRVTLIEKEKGGYSTKYRVRDGSGRVWVAKVGKEAKGETAASRLMWATGYYTDVNYLVPKVYVEGLDKPLENVRFGLRPKGVKRIAGWQWERNPFVGSRQFQGLKIMMALLNNWDLKPSNNKVLVARDKETANQQLPYFVSDLGGSFGKVSHIPRFLYFKPDRNNPKAYAKSHLVDKVKDDRVDLHFKLRKGRLYKNISVDDVQWMSGWLSRLSDRQIEDAFRSANYSPEEVRMMTQGVRRRINELNSVQHTLARTKNR